MNRPRIIRCSVSGLLAITLATAVVDGARAYAVEVALGSTVTARVVVRGQGAANWLFRRLLAGDQRAAALAFAAGGR
jgi:hypothetical protein